jgi:hypothetical protein
MELVTLATVDVVLVRVQGNGGLRWMRGAEQADGGDDEAARQARKSR